MLFALFSLLIFIVQNFPAPLPERSSPSSHVSPPPCRPCGAGPPGVECMRYMRETVFTDTDHCKRVHLDVTVITSCISPAGVNVALLSTRYSSRGRLSAPLASSHAVNGRARGAGDSGSALARAAVA